MTRTTSCEPLNGCPALSRASKALMHAITACKQQVHPISIGSMPVAEAKVWHRKWKLISHADTVNPFLASLVNHESRIKLTPIVLGNHTLIEWQGAIALLQSTCCGDLPCIAGRWLHGFEGNVCGTPFEGVYSVYEGEMTSSEALRSRGNATCWPCRHFLHRAPACAQHEGNFRQASRAGLPLAAEPPDRHCDVQEPQHFRSL